MQVTLFKALQSINIDNDTATDVVDQIEEHIAMKIEDANKGLESKLNALSAQITSFGVLLGLATLLIVGATLATKFIH